MPTQKSTIFAWLIHGTWARRARWTQDGSPLRTTLEQGLPAKVTFKLLPWTGRNRMPDREQATRELIQTVEQAKEDKGLRIAVAHSHGGNIAAYAAHAEPDLFDGVVTLNTPFMSLFQRDWSVIFLHQFILMVGVGVLMNWLLQLNIFVEGAIGLVLIAGVLGPMYIYRERLMLAAELVAMDVMRHAPSHTRTRVLCISTADDEAFSWLELVDVLINVPFLLLHRIALPLIFIVMTGAHYLFRWEFSTRELEFFNNAKRLAEQGISFGEAASQIFLGTPVPLTDEEITALTAVIYNEMPLALALGETVISSAFYFSAFFAILASASLTASVILRRVVFGEPIGLRALLYAMGTRLKVTLTPVYLTNVELRIVQSGESSWLRHSDAYASPYVLGAITEWIASLTPERTEAEVRVREGPTRGK